MIILRTFMKTKHTRMFVCWNHCLEEIYIWNLKVRDLFWTVVKILKHSEPIVLLKLLTVFEYFGTLDFIQFDAQRRRKKIFEIQRKITVAHKLQFYCFVKFKGQRSVNWWIARKFWWPQKILNIISNLISLTLCRRVRIL